MTDKVFKFEDHNVFERNVTNNRLGKDLSLHILNSNITVDLKKKTATGQITSYKSDKIKDSISESGVPQALLAVNFVMPFESTDKLDEQIVKYVVDNIEKIASV